MVYVKFGGEQIVKQLTRCTDNVSKFDLDGIVHDVLDEVADVYLQSMQSRVMPHKRKGDAYDTLGRTEVKRNGNYQYVEVGALDLRGKNKDGFHIVYQEYGSPNLSADPWMRPAAEENKGVVKKMIQEALAARGISNG